MKESARSAVSYSVLIISSPKQAPRTRTFSTTIKNWVEKAPCLYQAPEGRGY